MLMTTSRSDCQSEKQQQQQQQQNPVAQARAEALSAADLRADQRANAILAAAAAAESRAWATVVDQARAPAQTHERFVFTSYRPALPSLGLCLRSMFAWHNATLSIWSSLLLAALNLYLGLDRAMAAHAAGGSATRVKGFAIHGGARAACWIASWAYHTFAPHSPALAEALLCADYVGCLITMYAVGGNLMLQLFEPAYYAGVATTISGGALYLAMKSGGGGSSSARVQRGLVAGSAAMAACVLATALLVGYGGDDSIGSSSAAPLPLTLLLVAMAFETAGAAVFFFCIPERWFPHNQLVDCLANSHALWHLANVGFDVYTMRFAWAAFASAAAMGQRVSE